MYEIICAVYRQQRFAVQWTGRDEPRRCRGHCYSPSTGGYAGCFGGDGYNAYSQGGVTEASLAPPVPTVNPGTGAPTAAARNGAPWLVTENGRHSGALDAVTPYIGAVSLSDAYRPNRRLTVNAGARLENFTFRLAETGGPYPARPFWYAAYNRENGFSPGSYATTSAMLDPATGTWTCPAGSSHVALSGSASADTVVRGSYGRYSARPPVRTRCKARRNRNSRRTSVSSYRSATRRRITTFIPLLQTVSFFARAAHCENELRLQRHAASAHDARSNRSHADRTRRRGGRIQHRSPDVERRGIC